jgi:excinuclease UvrABC nuclease subunit
MPISGDFYEFKKSNVDQSPDSPGVYALWDGSELIYYGRAETSIRQRLQRHYAGDAGRCTQGATQYQRERTMFSVSQEKALLIEYKREHGRLPRCNERIG